MTGVEKKDGPRLRGAARVAVARPRTAVCAAPKHCACRIIRRVRVKRVGSTSREHNIATTLPHFSTPENARCPFYQAPGVPTKHSKKCRPMIGAWRGVHANARDYCATAAREEARLPANSMGMGLEVRREKRTRVSCLFHIDHRKTNQLNNQQWMNTTSTQTRIYHDERGSWLVRAKYHDEGWS